MVRAYQVRGHLLADIDPLRLTNHGVDNQLISRDSLDLHKFGLSEADLDKEFDLSTPEIRGFQQSNRGKQKLRDIIRRLKETYTNTVGVEYMHISSTEECNFIRDRMETPESVPLTRDEKLQTLDRLCWADHFERFLAVKYATAKRFGLEGAESLIPAMKAMIDRAAELGVDDVVIGMAHRGRLNVLASVVKKPIEQIFGEFSGGGGHEDFGGSGDVKYHLGASHDREVAGKKVHLTLVANPSHLEAVDPVVLGKVRAKQFLKKQGDANHVLPVLLHGDAAFAGQGIVYETMGFNQLDDYSVGGTIHIVINNQIGFTTDPMESRSNAYCSDIAKAFGAPIFHVNGDDIEAVVKVCRIASEWRQQFKRDVVIDLVCYRKYGHNELDEPKFTQPFMYQSIAHKKSPYEIYVSKLLAEGTITQEDVERQSAKVNKELNEKFEASKTYKTKSSEWLASDWSGIKSSASLSQIRTTGISRDLFDKIGKALVDIPSDFNIHPRLKNIIQNKAKALESGSDIDWGTGEALAFGSLLWEGYHVRLSGQDVERGTFSHRHAVIHDQVDKDKLHLIPLERFGANGKLTICNSSLSEFGVLGFELGYSLESPNQLVLWEAQFGDFANGAQIMFDQFLSSGEAKWMRQCGLVTLLPHGYEGQGPEHSSCRLERFLQMCNDDEDVFPDMEQSITMQVQKSNWQVVNCSTPANYFHVLRRQVHRDFRKPLIVATPKSLLRLKQAASTFEEFGPETKFRRLIPEIDTVISEDKVRSLVFCSGKVYYDLLAYRTENKIHDVAIARIEQLSPFPFDLVLQEAQKYKNAQKIIWAQEEPKNMGSWFYTSPRIKTSLRSFNGASAIYVGRPPAASPATGFSKIHKLEQDELVKKAFA